MPPSNPTDITLGAAVPSTARNIAGVFWTRGDTYVDTISYLTLQRLWSELRGNWSWRDYNATYQLSPNGVIVEGAYILTGRTRNTHSITVSFEDETREVSWIVVYQPKVNGPIVPFYVADGSDTSFRFKLVRHQTPKAARGTAVKRGLFDQADRGQIVPGSIRVVPALHLPPLAY